MPFRTGTLAVRGAWWLPAAVLSGILLWGSLPPFEHGWAAFVAFVPALAALRRAGASRAIAGGCIVLVTACALTLLTAERTYGNDGLIETLRLFLGFGLLILPVFILYSLVRQWSPLTIWALVSGAVLWEAALSRYLPASLAWTQHRSPGMLYLASATGWWGIVGAVWATNLFLARVPFLQPLRRSVPSLLACSATLAASALVFPPQPQSDSALRVFVLQGEDLSPSAVHQAVRDRTIELLVLPKVELSLEETRALSALADSPAMVVTNEGRSWVWNSMQPNALASEEPVRGVRVLVPQDPSNPLGHDLRLIGFRAALVAVPRATRRSPHEIIAAADAASLAIASASLGVSIVRADTAGFSRVIGPTGAVLAETRRHTTGTGCLAAIPATGVSTFYGLAGDWMVWLLTAILLLQLCVWALQRLGVLWVGQEEEAPLRILPRLEREPYSRN
jgi:apolipoprotein N-acyltransferase